MLQMPLSKDKHPASMVATRAGHCQSQIWRNPHRKPEGARSDMGICAGSGIAYR